MRKLWRRHENKILGTYAALIYGGPYVVWFANGGTVAQLFG